MFDDEICIFSIYLINQYNDRETLNFTYYYNFFFSYLLFIMYNYVASCL